MNYLRLIYNLLKTNPLYTGKGGIHFIDRYANRKLDIKQKLENKGKNRDEIRCVLTKLSIY